MLEKEEYEDISDYYEWVLTPINATDENKSGVTFKGNDQEYFNAHHLVGELTKKKGDRFVINGVEISVADAPENKPVTIGIKCKTGLTGKANLTVYDKNIH